MYKSDLDARLATWLRDAPSASPWVLAGAIDHARTHPRRQRLPVRWSGAMKAITLGRPLAPAFRLLIVLAILVLALTIAGVAYVGSRQNAVSNPTPTSGAFVCPPGTNPDQPGAADQPQPGPLTPRAAVDSRSGLLILLAADPPAVDWRIWTFDLCMNTWTESSIVITASSTEIEASPQPYPIYDVDSDVVAVFEGSRVTAYDPDTDTTPRSGSTPIVGAWSGVYDPLTGLILVRELRTSRMWTFDVDSDDWQEIAQLGDIPPGGNSSGAYLITFDTSTDRVVLYAAASGGRATYEFDPRASTWARQPNAPPALAYSWYDTRRYSSAYDQANARTVVYNSGRVIAYDATAHRWEIALDVPGVRSSWGGVAMAYDPANQRIVAIGGNARGEAVAPEDTVNDVAAFDMRTRTWTELLAGSGS